MKEGVVDYELPLSEYDKAFIKSVLKHWKVEEEWCHGVEIHEKEVLHHSCECEGKGRRVLIRGSHPFVEETVADFIIEAEFDQEPYE